jgi:hypothetical protein
MTSETPDLLSSLQIARVVQAACVNTAKEAYEQAEISGLCCEGAFEAAIGAIEMLDVEALLTEKLM